MKKIDYKVEQGKLLRIKIKEKNGIIEDIKIRGDFFIYPETGLFSIEKFLINKKIDNFKEGLAKHLQKESIKVIGFSPDDLQLAINIKK